MCVHQENRRITPAPSNLTKYAQKTLCTKTPLSRGVTGKTFPDTENNKKGTLGCLWYVQRSRQIVTGPRADYGLAKTKQKVIKKPYNKLLTNRASSSRTGEYWPWVVFVRTERSEVRTATTSGQYFPGSTALALG